MSVLVMVLVLAVMVVICCGSWGWWWWWWLWRSWWWYVVVAVVVSIYGLYVRCLSVSVPGQMGRQHVLQEVHQSLTSRARSPRGLQL